MVCVEMSGLPPSLWLGLEVVVAHGGRTLTFWRFDDGRLLRRVEPGRA
jgi:plasmid replication initiation protein